MPRNQINIKSDKSFPWHFKLLAVVFIIVSLVIVADQPIISAVLSFICLLILTARAGVEVDLDNKTFREYMSFFYIIRMGQTHSFPNLDILYINAHNSSQKIYAYSTQSMTLKDRHYNIFLRFTDGETLKLWSQKNKQDLMAKAQLLATKMSIDLIDYTEQDNASSSN